MKKEELIQQLTAMGVPEVLYDLSGKGNSDDAYNLVKEGDVWQVYYFERGSKINVFDFTTEEEAYDYLLKEFSPAKSKINMENIIFPIGSIVVLKEGKIKLMITTRAVNVTMDGKQRYFDYGAVAYPIGLEGDRLFYFQRNAVAQVLFIGYIDEKEKEAVGRIRAFENEHPDLRKNS